MGHFRDTDVLHECLITPAFQRLLYLGLLNSLCCWYIALGRLHEQRCCITAGEAQKIDRIMERFADRYCKDNPDVFQTSDGAYLLSFALIMLNTDAHNPMADKKLSLEDFISMCQYQVIIYLRTHCTHTIVQ